MKFLTNKEVFLEKINLASKFTSSKLSSSSSLQGVLLKGDEGKIHFYSTNLNFYYHGAIKIEGSYKFNAVVEPKKILEFISLLPSGKIEVEIKEKTIVIIQGKTKGEFSLFSPEDFPLPPALNSKKQIIKTEFFKKSLPLMLFSASTDETRPVLTGINFVSRDGASQIVSTDGFRLSLLNFKKEFPFPSAIVPSRFLSETARFFSDEKEFNFNYNDKEKILAFFINEDEFYTRLIDGEYPLYEKVIPGEKKTIVNVVRDEFLRNIKLISVFARDFSNIIILHIERGGIKISPKTGGKEENVAFQEAEVQGEDQKIAFNFKFLIDFLTNTQAEKIIIELLKSDSPAVFKEEKNDDFLHIIMPVRIQE